jgi:hypothetical protein
MNRRQFFKRTVAATVVVNTVPVVLDAEPMAPVVLMPRPSYGPLSAVLEDVRPMPVVSTSFRTLFHEPGFKSLYFGHFNQDTESSDSLKLSELPNHDSLMASADRARKGTV